MSNVINTYNQNEEISLKNGDMLYIAGIRDSDLYDEIGTYVEVCNYHAYNGHICNTCPHPKYCFDVYIKDNVLNNEDPFVRACGFILLDSKGREIK